MNSVYTLLADIDDVLTEAGIPGDTSLLRRVKELVYRYQEAQAETKRADLQAQFAKERNTELYQQLDRQQKRILALRRELERYVPAAEVQWLLLEAT